jgi:hypothetical protein
MLRRPLLVIAGICTLACGVRMDRKWAARAYTATKKPGATDALQLLEDGTFVHAFLDATGARHEQRGAWTLKSGLLDNLIEFQGLAGGAHPPCSRACTEVAAIEDGDQVMSIGPMSCCQGLVYRSAGSLP